MSGRYCDVSHDGIEAFTTYGDAQQGILFWDGIQLPLQIGLKQYRGIYLSFAYVDNPGSIYYGKHIAYMQEIDIPNTGIFCVCEDNLVQLIHAGAYGSNPGIVSRRGDLVYQSGGFSYVYNGASKQIPLPGGTSQGIAYLDDNYQPVWMDSVIGHNTPTYGGHKFVRAYVIGGWVFGQSLEDQIIAYELSTGRVFQVSSVKTQVAPRGNVANGIAICAISEPGMFVHQSAFTLISGPPAEDPFKKNVLAKLNNALTPAELAYLKQLVESDM